MVPGLQFCNSCRDHQPRSFYTSLQEYFAENCRPGTVVVFILLSLEALSCSQESSFRELQNCRPGTVVVVV